MSENSPQGGGYIDLTELAHRSAFPAAVDIWTSQASVGRPMTTPFDQISRTLFRRSNNHVLLTGPRGVGKTALVWELALRAARGMIPFLEQKRFLWIDCRNVAPEESRRRIEEILATHGSERDLIACIDGLSEFARLSLQNSLMARRG